MGGASSLGIALVSHMKHWVGSQYSITGYDGLCLESQHSKGIGRRLRSSRTFLLLLGSV